MYKAKIYITGAGPGDAGLITVKALNILRKADVVIYDYLINNALLKECKSSCEKIYVGKKAGNHSSTQDTINELLIEKSKNSKIVVRLKGGDPFVFGRGGEEALFLAERKIDFEIIPGITSGIAAAAYAGIPVTHRNLASSVSFISGHDVQDSEDLNINWQAIAALKGTLVFYMGVQNLEKICQNLINNGLSSKTPIAIIRYGTYNFQEYVQATLENIVTKAHELQIKAPALIVVGEVINLHESINWYSNRPLFGKRIMVTRSRNQASSLTAILEEKGAEVIEFPTIQLQALNDYSVAKTEIQHINKFKWILFTSVNTVTFFFKLLHELSFDSRKLASNKIASVGKETSRALLERGIKADLEPENFTAEAMVKSFAHINLQNVPILIPASNIAKEILANELEKKGAIVERISLYENREPDYTIVEIQQIFEKPLDCITFTSSSTVTNLFNITKNYPFVFEKIKSVDFATIGPVTSRTVIKNGLNVSIESQLHTIESLAETIENYYYKKK